MPLVVMPQPLLIYALNEPETPEDAALNVLNAHRSWTTFARTFPESWSEPEGDGKVKISLKFYLRAWKTALGENSQGRLSGEGQVRGGLRRRGH